MMAIPGVREYRTGGLYKLLRAVYQGGVIYYGFISIVSILNVVVILTLPRDYVHLLAAFERVLHSVLSSRAILHIREIASRSGPRWAFGTELEKFSAATGSETWNRAASLTNADDVLAVGSASVAAPGALSTAGSV
ncbi:hypothetical protein V5O48_008152 [Marasmius crinis-equi]|uniref:Uncharacterized protein n=1 Tax=Marasmius crinis-equi TaxID=585013 RepID=A0ABR3FEQ9_9AGAR